MPVFQYKAKNRNAETVQGSITARSQEEAIELINQLGLLPVNVEIRSANERHFEAKIRPYKVRTKDLYFFTRNLANLLKSGVSLLRALSIIEEQIGNLYFKQIINDIVVDIKNGRSLSQSITKYPSVFAPLYITMVYAGEESGHLHNMLINIADYLKRQQEIASKVRLALTYPVFMAFVGAGTILFILLGVLPKMGSLFRNLGDNIPLPTAIMLQSSLFLRANGLWVLIACLLFFLFVYHWLQSDAGKRFTGKMTAKAPLFGEIILKTELARFCRTMVLLMKNGVSVVRALQVVIPLMDNLMIRTELERCEQELIGGGSFGEALKKTKDMSGIMAHMIAIGEETGNLEEVLSDVAESFESEADEHIKAMTTLLEPFMILVVGSIVGLMVFAILLPIFQTSMLNF
jgi:type IV pilus assembly protein PilC